MTRRRLAFLTDCFDDEFQNALLRELFRAVEGSGLDLISVQGGILGNPFHREKHFVYDLVTPDHVDGVFVSTHTLSHFATTSEVERFVRSYAPLPTISLGVAVDGVSSLVVDNEDGFFRVVRHLIEEHHLSRIGFVGGPEKNPEARARLKGYLRALRTYGLPEEPAWIVPGDFCRPSGTRAVEILLDEYGVGTDEIEAIACANDETAVGVMIELERRGIRVPRDIAVVGFDGIESLRHRRTPLTSARQPIGDQMRFAVDHLSAAIEGNPLDPSVTIFPVEMVVGRSCGCCCRPFNQTSARMVVGRVLDQNGEEGDPRIELELTLGASAAGLPDSLERGWSDTLATSFLGDGLSDDPEPFFETVEDLLFELLEHGGSVAAMQDLLMVLRSWALGREDPGSPEAASVDAVCQHALLVVGDVAQIPLATRYREQMKRMLELSVVAGQLTAVPDLSNLDFGLKSLVPLGIGSSVVSLYPVGDADDTDLEVVDIHDPRAVNSTEGLRFAADRMAPPGFLDGRSAIVQPLVHRKDRLGVAVFEIGSEGVVYELLRQAISLAVQGARLAHQVSQLAIRDPLTGLFNRRYLDPHLEVEVERAHRHERPLTVAVVDLDHFKSVNDRHGHDAGDHVLIRIVEALRASLRSTDILARYGGDEFVITAPEAGRVSARSIARRVLEAVEEVGRTVDPVVTASIGLATIVSGDESVGSAELLHRADQALLHAKAQGKARAAHWDGLDVESVDGTARVRRV